MASPFDSHTLPPIFSEEIPPFPAGRAGHPKLNDMCVGERKASPPAHEHWNVVQLLGHLPLNDSGRRCEQLTVTTVVNFIEQP